MPFEFKKLAIPDVVLVIPQVFGDSRGFFLEFFKSADFVRAGIGDPFVQDNHSKSSKGVLRGLHFQKAPHGQGKLVRCIQGRIYDVAVDIRKGSPHFGKWVGEELTDQNHHMLYVPPGFAHGFLVQSDTAEVIYKCTAEYVPSADRGIIWNDPDIGIRWPVHEPLLSEKDRALPSLRSADTNYTY